jgi:diacylglycerol kinase (ATP)
MPDTPPDESPTSAFKSQGGLRRIAHAMAYSLAGLRAAIRHEAAFRQELALAVPMLLLMEAAGRGSAEAAVAAALAGKPGRRTHRVSRGQRPVPRTRGAL